MVTISHLVEKIVNERPLLFQAIEQGIVSFGNLAEQLEKEINDELGKDVNRSAVVMALRRYSEKIEGKSKVPKFGSNSRINVVNLQKIVNKTQIKKLPPANNGILLSSVFDFNNPIPKRIKPRISPKTTNPDISIERSSLLRTGSIGNINNNNMLTTSKIPELNDKIICLESPSMK